MCGSGMFAPQVRKDISNSVRLAWIVATALTVFLLWITTEASANAGVGFFYMVPIGLAAWWGGGRWAASAVAGCIALYAAGSLIQPVPDFGLALAVRLIAFAAVAALVSIARERVSVLEHSAEELEDIRAALTPSELVEVPHVDAATAFVPSDHGVSGDFYLLTNGPDGSTVAIVGDVVGHGPQAARLATFIRASFAAFVANTSDPGELLSMANGALIDRPGPEHELVSAVCLRFQAEGTELSWAVAGHPPPLRLPLLEALRPDGETFLLGTDPDLELSTAHASLDPEGGVLVYTDGATDVRQGGALLGLNGLSRLVKPLAQLPARAMAAQAEKAILAWTDEPLRDDLCLLVLRPRN